MRATRAELALPPGLSESSEAEGCDAFIALIDAASLGEAAAKLAGLPARVRIFWAMPVEGSGVVGWLAARARRVRPVVLEEACEALRHGGVVDVRLTRVEGPLAMVVLSGVSTL